MIIDSRIRYRIVDRETGDPVPEEWIFYADDEAGVYQCYVPDAEGLPHVGPDDRFVTTEVKANIRIVPVTSQLDSNIL